MPRLAFAGSPTFAAEMLQILLTQGAACGWQVDAVLTAPDRAAGRGQKVRHAPTKSLALSHKLPLYQPASLRDTRPMTLISDAPPPDLLIIAAYGLLLPPAWLDWARLGAINIHTSLLPRWRGAAPIERAIMAGDAQTGVCVMKMDAGLDTGAVLARAVCPIEAQDNAPRLEQKLIALCPPLFTQVLTEINRTNRLPAARPQAEEGVTYAAKLIKQDALIHWRQPAEVIDRQVRAFAGRGGAQTRLADGTGLHILEAEPADCAAAPAPEAAPTPAAGTLRPAGKGRIHIQCAPGILNVKRARLTRGKGSILSAADLQNGFPTDLRSGVQLQNPCSPESPKS